MPYKLKPLITVAMLSCLSLQACKPNTVSKTAEAVCSQDSVTPACIAENAQQVLAAIEDPFSYATSAAELAIAYDALGDAKAATVLFEAALAKADGIDDSNKQAGAYGDIALALSKVKAAPQIVPLIEQLIMRADKIGSDDKKWDVLGKLMTARAVHGDKNAARSMALSMPSSTYSQDAFKGRTQREIAEKFAKYGDFVTAIAVMNEIEADFTYYSAIARTDVTAMAIEAGKNSLVEPLFKEAVSIANTQDNGYFSGAILRDIGYSLVKLGEAEKADAMFARAAEKARNAKSDQEKARALSRIATSFSDCGLDNKSAPILTEALSIARTIESEAFTNYALYEIAGSAAFSGEFTMARDLLTEIPVIPFGSAVSLKAASERDLAWGLARYGQINEALSVANAIDSPREKVHTLSRLVRLLKDPEMNALPRYL